MHGKILVYSLIAAALAAPQGQEPVAIISQDSVVNPDGSFNYGYESADGTKVQQSGQLKQLPDDKEGNGEAIQGSFSYLGTDGVTYQINYIADENGFVPQGDHLPVAPPVPEAIARALEYNAAHPEEDGN
ncbi:hypothetical protein C0J52_20617 [Blattella germanica]|nr:hypothetical protein C0J52_20617 [Blattella germanica]